MKGMVWKLSKVCFWLSMVLMLCLAVAVYAVPYDVAQLSPERGGPLLLLDRHGALLRSVPSLSGGQGRHGWVPLDSIPSQAVLTVLASEDRRFFQHKGVDPLGVLRAMVLNLRNRRVVYGGSTITMQLVRMVHSPGQPRTLANKVRESVLAMRLERVMSKQQILEQYLNRAYYANGAWGLEAAARTYFGKPAAGLSAGEATLLAVIPRGPRYYDPISHLDRALGRRDHVFGLLVEQGLMSRDQVQRARAQPVRPRIFRPPFHAPHFTDWVLATLPPLVHQQGGTVRTTLDLSLQQQLQRRVAQHTAALRGEGVAQAGLVVLDTATGQVLALVGSPDYGGEQGQVNIVTRRRHPGSALKPFVYALALERGESPASIAYDIHDVPESAYRVINLTQPEHGPVRFREALAGSYNLAAVHVLERVGVDALISRLRRAGVGPLQGDQEDYGLRLALGSAKVRLVDLAAAYGFLVRGGSVTPPVSVLHADLPKGKTWQLPPAAPRRIFSPQVSWLVMDMLADPVARRPVFGTELPLDLPFRVAAKTGTARGFADTVTVGVTRELSVAAWAGNFDGKPTHGVVAMQGAAPLVRDGLLIAGRGADLTLPPRPAGIVTRAVCALSGKPASMACPHRKAEYFMAGKALPGRCDWHRRTRDGLRVIYPQEISAWAQRQRTQGGRHL